MYVAKFFDTDTALYEYFSKGKFIEYGIFIDIFVLDHIPVEKVNKKIIYGCSAILQIDSTLSKAF